VTPSPTPAASATPVPTQPPVNQDLNLTRGGDRYTINGTLVDEKTGAPVIGATIELDGQPVSVGPDGIFTVEAADGRHSLVASAPGYATVSTSVVVDGGALTEPLRLSMPSAADTPRPDGIPCCGLPLAALVLLIIGLYRHGRA